MPFSIRMRRTSQATRTSQVPRSRVIQRAVPVILGLALITLAAGCSRSRAMDRSKVLEAENINQRQKLATYEEQIRQQHLAQDDFSAREQQMRADLMAARKDAELAAAARQQAGEARGRLVQVQNDLSASESELAEVSRKYEDLLRQRQAVRVEPRVARTGGPTAVRPGGVSPEAEAMRRDLQRQLASYGVRELNVEIRREASGQERVAIVLPDAFKAGKATLAYNPQAVKAVIGVGKMIREHYKNSTVVVEGHTDSDPIRKSGWGTNERLSDARAQAVERLLTNAGIPASNVSTQGIGARRPLALGNSKAAKSRNRRVEIFITPGA